MKALSKIFKGIGKFVKKIGRGIKKVVKKVKKAVGKLGIVGTIGMMFLMPYAMQGLGSLFQGLNAAKVGSWAHTLAGGGRIAQTVSSAMNAIHTAGTWAFGSGAGTLRGAISDGVSSLLGTGGTDLVSAANTLGETGKTILDSSVRGIVPDAGGSLVPSGAFQPSSLMSPATSSALTTGSRVQAGLAKATGNSKWTDFVWNTMPETRFASTTPITTQTAGQALLSPTEIGSAERWSEAANKYITSDAYDATTSGLVGTGQETQSWYSRLGSGMRTQWDSIVSDLSSIDAGDIAKQSVLSGLSTRGARAIAGDPPVQEMVVTQRPDLTSDLITSNMSNIYAQSDLMFQKIGNSYQGPNLMNFDVIKAIGNDGTADYHANMRGLEFMVSQPSYAA